MARKVSYIFDSPVSQQTGIFIGCLKYIPLKFRNFSNEKFYLYFINQKNLGIFTLDSTKKLCLELFVANLELLSSLPLLDLQSG